MVKLHSYQKDGLDWILRHKASGLFFPPGLGKTLVTLSAIKILIDHEEGIDRILIIAPLRVLYMVWPLEIAKWGFDFSVGMLHGKDKDTTIRQKHDIYLINPEGLKWLFTKHSRKFDMLVIDESTMFKNYSSARFKLMKEHVSQFKRKIILTGTPAPNGLLQLWPQVFLLDFGKRLGKNISTFRRRWFSKSFTGFGYDLTEGADMEIYSAIDDLVMHKSNSELNMPDKLNNTILVRLPDNVMKQYREMLDEFIIELEHTDDITATNAAAKCSKLKQVANGTVYGEDREIIVMHDEKLNATEELVDSLAGRPLMIVYEHLHDLARLKERFKAPAIGGGIKEDDLADIIQMWNAGQLPILLIQPRVGGHGLNLQDGGCHDVLHYSIPYDLELYDQTNARVYRQGVKNNVTIHHMVAERTIDTKIMAVLANKANLQDELLDYLKK